jgi:hypothetical protein
MKSIEGSEPSRQKSVDGKHNDEADRIRKWSGGDDFGPGTNAKASIEG